MDADFVITTDTARNLLEVRMSGFFTLADVARYERGIDAACSRLYGDTSQQAVICDITGMKIQTQDVVEAFARVLGEPRHAGRRVALVVGTSLARMQAQRASALARREARVFADRAAAEAWLFGEERAVA